MSVAGSRLVPEVPEGVVPGSIQTLGCVCGGFDVASRMVPDLENLGAHCRLVAPEITGGSRFGDDVRCLLSNFPITFAVGDATWVYYTKKHWFYIKNIWGLSTTMS